MRRNKKGVFYNDVMIERERCLASEGNNAPFGTACDGVEGSKHRMEKDASRPRTIVFPSKEVAFLPINVISVNCRWTFVKIRNIMFVTFSKATYLLPTRYTEIG